MPKISDAELLNAELSVTDAYAQGGHVLEKLPTGVDITGVIHAYRHERYPAEKVFCCICGNAKHKSGWRVIRSDEKETLVGSCCGEDVARQHFKFGTAKLKEQIERQKYLYKIHAFQPRILKVQSLLWGWGKLARELRAERYKFRVAMPEVYERLEQAASGTGELIAVERTGYNEDDQPIDVVVRHALSGKAFLQRGDPVERITKLESAISNFCAVAANTDTHKTKKLKSVVTQLEEKIQALSELAEMEAAIPHFFGNRNLAGIQQWADLLRSGHAVHLRYDISASEGTITNLKTGTSVTQPTNLEFPSDEIFKLLYSAEFDAA